MSEWFKRLLLLFIGFVSAVLIAEVALRIVAPRVLIQPLGIVLDSNLIYRLPPNTYGAYGKQEGEWYMEVRTNSYGLRDREILYDRTPGIYRILGLGDSMTFAEGAELEEIYYKRLEKSLSRKLPVEVINAAVRGWGPDQQVAFFDQKGYRYHPDATLVAFYSGNDFEDTLHGNLYRIENGEAVHQPVSVETSTKYRYYSQQHRIQRLPLYSWMMSHSHLANLLRQAYPRLAIRRIYRRRIDDEVNFANLNKQEEERAWALVRGIYEHLFSEREKTGRLFFILIPTYDEVKEGASPQVERMVELCRERGIPHLNLLPGLHRQVSLIDKLYYPKDKHFSPAGHAWVAQQLEEALDTAGIPSKHSSSK